MLHKFRLWVYFVRLHTYVYYKLLIVFIDMRFLVIILLHLTTIRNVDLLTNFSCWYTDEKGMNNNAVV